MKKMLDVLKGVETVVIAEVEEKEEVKVEEKEEVKVEDKEDEIPQEVKDIIEGEKSSIGENVTTEILGQIYSKENLSMKTDLTRKSAVTISKGRIIAQHFKCDVLDDFIDEVLEHLISNKRLGRVEMVDTIKNSQESYIDEEPKSNVGKIFK